MTEKLHCYSEEHAQEKDAMRVLMSMHESCSESENTLPNLPKVRSWISINEIKKMVGNIEAPINVSTSSKNGGDSALFNSFGSLSASNRLQYRQKSSLNTTRSKKPLVEVNLLDDRLS